MTTVQTPCGTTRIRTGADGQHVRVCPSHGEVYTVTLDGTNKPTVVQTDQVR